MAKKYIVTLSEEEREYLKEYVRKGKASGFRLKHAEILLKLNAIPENKEWTHEKIGNAHGRKREAVGDIAKRFVEEGIESAICRRHQENRARKIDGKVEARIIALLCMRLFPRTKRCGSQRSWKSITRQNMQVGLTWQKSKLALCHASAFRHIPLPWTN